MWRMFLGRFCASFASSCWYCSYGQLQMLPAQQQLASPWPSLPWGNRPDSFEPTPLDPSPILTFLYRPVRYSVVSAPSDVVLWSPAKSDRR
ncbi:hypothetical protein BGW36DRAFT_77429 [Talaromyces proteolyticus]|uniref:Secreted protein n=1 Tax=Talaromyces proteolyticus TaxID=1131652 RepID=A0AAD4PRL0_9EURO|nr:uncharacterized protein BGW36DRAFT_77429 [Talaromyces proteolyticus]KAH8689102.1 hypothetical protein BGW36DRAFT_77429 [Talaromyces proteolyticus]